jgi:hypothetical protein
MATTHGIEKSRFPENVENDTLRIISLSIYTVEELWSSF